MLEDEPGINSSGQVVGYGLYNSTMQGFLLDIDSHAPEPASMLLFGSGIALLAAARKFHR